MSSDVRGYLRNGWAALDGTFTGIANVKGKKHKLFFFFK